MKLYFHPTANAGINLLALDPLQKGLRHAANFGGNRLNGCPQQGLLSAMLLHQAHGAFTDFRGKLVRFLHGSVFSGVGASSKLN